MTVDEMFAPPKDYVLLTDENFDHRVDNGNRGHWMLMFSKPN